MSAPDPDTIDAWLNGELPEEEIGRLDAYFDANPSALPGWDEIDDLLPELGVGDAGRDERLDALVERFKTSPGMERQWMPSDIRWEEILEPAEETADGRKILGMLGEYEVEELIATGGMGILFKARDPKLERTVALKVLAPQLATLGTARERFLREARAAAKLENENILPIYAVYDGDLPYFSMRYVDGGTLEDRLQSGRKLELEQLKSVARQVASALEAAHEAGIVHRDIKPANILFDGAGEQIWVCDFGIARSVEDPSLTYAGSVAGTPQHMSPEQAKGLELDGRSDLFSLGTVLYRAATGRHLYSGDTTSSVLLNLANDAVPRASQIDGYLPRWFARLLENLLAKDPGDRPSNANAVVRCIDDEYAPRPGRAARRNRRLGIACAVIAVLLLAGFVLLQIPAVRGVANRTLLRVNGDRVTIDGCLGTHANLAGAIAAARDGDLIFVHGDSPLGATLIEIPEGKRLTLRAIPGSSPLVELTPGVSGILSRSPLVVEGLRFRDPEPAYHSRGAIVFSQSRGNIVRRCQFHFHSTPENEFAARRPRAISVEDGAEVTIESCYFDHVESCAVLVKDSRRAPEDGSELTANAVTFRSCILTGARVLTTVRFANTAAVELGLHGCLVASDALFYDFWNSDLPSMAFEVSECVLAPTSSLLWTPREPLATLKKQISWKGSSNIYRSGTTYLHDHVDLDKGHAARLKIPIFEEWIGSIAEENGTREQAFALAPEDIRESFAPAQLGTAALDLPFVQRAMANKPVAPRDGVLIEGGSAQFQNLKSAIATAPDGATLLLRGELRCPETIITPSDRTLHLRPAPGTTATIIASLPAEHALFVAGSMTIKGIRFIRPEPSNFAMPMLGTKSGNLVVEDCFFHSPAGPGEDAVNFGLAISGSKATPGIVRRCRFDLPAGFAIYAGGGDILIEECLVVGRGVIHRHERTPDRRASISVSRSVAVCDVFFRNTVKTELYPTDLKTSGNLFDIRDHLLVIPGVTRAVLEENLAWAGNDNRFAPNLAVLSAPAVRAGSDFDPFSLNSITELSKASSERDIEIPPFDRQHLPAQPDPSDLRAALPTALESPAIDTLEWFVEEEF